MEALQELEPCYIEHIRDYELSTEQNNSFVFQRNDKLSIIPDQNVKYKKISQEVIKPKATGQKKQDESTVKEDLELTKQKVKDNLSEVSKDNIRNMVKAEVKANTAIKVVKTELQAIINQKTSLEKYLQECQYQLGYLKEQYRIEQTNRKQLDREMQTVAIINDILSDQIGGYEKELKELFATLAELKNKATEIDQQDRTEQEAFEMEYTKNDTQIRQLKIELKSKCESLRDQEQFLQEKMRLQENISQLQERVAVEKEKNRELTERKAEYVRRLAERVEKKSGLKEKLNSVLASKEKAKEMLAQQKSENQQLINSKRLELELLKQKSEIQLNYINELNMELESLKNKNESLLRANDEIKQESDRNYEDYQQLCNKMQENRVTHKNELAKYNEEAKLIQEKLQKVNESIGIEITEIENLEMEIVTKEQLLKDASIKMSTLNDIQDDLKREIENQNIIQQKCTEENSRLNNTLNTLQAEVAQLNAQYHEAEKDDEILQSKCTEEINQLQQNLNNAEIEKAALIQDAIEFENVKVKDEERLNTLKQENTSKLEELQAELEALQEKYNTEQATVKDLSTKLQTKNELRDKLRIQHQELQKQLKQLEDTNTDSGMKRPQPVQKSGGILKTSTLKSPQKKVTFDNNVKSVNLSESSQDSVFDTLIKGFGSRPNDNKPNESGDFSVLFKRNSPPERDFGK